MKLPIEVKFKESTERLEYHGAQTGRDRDVANTADHWRTEAARHSAGNYQLTDALATAHRHLSIYRWVAIVGWLIAIALLTLQPTYASAATLPAGSLACDNSLAYEAQMLTFSDATLVADPGCVFTDRDLVVYPVQGNEVFVEEIGFSVWADVEVLK